MATEKGISRRSFLVGASAAAAGVAAVGLTACNPEPEVPVWMPEKWDYEADVVVLGFGFAGQAAALEAADLGASVIVADTASRAYVGGSSTANQHHDFSFIGPNVATNIKYVTSECWGTVEDPDVIRRQIEENHKLPDWLAGLGATIVFSTSECTHPTIPGGKEMEAPNNRFVALSPQSYIDKFPCPGSGLSPYTEWWIDLMEERNVTMMYNTRGEELVQDGATKNILGVKCLEGVTYTKDFKLNEGSGKEIFIKAKKGVVVATGGYEANEEMLRDFAPHPHSAFITMYGSPYSDGSGLTMCCQVGARLWHLNKKEAHSFACAPASFELGVGNVVTSWANSIATHPGIMVNRDGKRFYNEYHYSGHSDDARAWDEFEQKNAPVDNYTYCDYRNTPFYHIFDNTTFTKKKLGSPNRFVEVSDVYRWSSDNKPELAKGWIIQADTLDALAKKIVIRDWFGAVVGMDAKGLVETVAKYNEDAAEGEDTLFGRRASTMLPIVDPPFFAMEIADCQTNTQGGPKHDADCRVLDSFDRPIPGLYIAGELGSIFGHLYNGGENIPESSSGGRRAAQHAVTRTAWDAVE